LAIWLVPLKCDDGIPSAASTERFEADGHERALDTGAPAIGSAGLQLLVGCGPGARPGKVALVQTAEAHLERV